ncbi:hypothetical protein ACA910_017972 [Epithemia clementina (nom. ined.)]
MYTGGQQYHAKVSPFLLGLKPHIAGAKETNRTPLTAFREVFLEMWQQPPQPEPPLPQEHHSVTTALATPATSSSGHSTATSPISVAVNENGNSKRTIKVFEGFFSHHK